MLRMLLLFAFAAAIASQIPYLLGLTDLGRTELTPAARSAVATPSQPISFAAVRPATPGTVVLPADARGHFSSTFKLNGKPVEGMVDTGASLLAINESTARRLGFSANSLDFKYTTSTANGETKMALVTLDRVEIDGIRVSGVRAAVLRDTSLSDTLIGMSFLTRLASFKVEAGQLQLKQ
ncbi:TIGR02281 family clan AA aspartic protease [Affinirhizobium pseudoryzae]|jgi:aspartyl protease family protein|uniref:TIGR02281 family clan AA aspartic protease n=1 Tax=Allorhizobium pseudoryzae TaxID=379684 RepID=UPI001F424EA1|nr:TIGR02281 family clan AA aspartic protease [Allorhizobium pseudoryzae]